MSIVKEFVEKLAERLEELKEESIDKWDGGASHKAYVKAIEIVSKLAEEYNQGWIPVTEKLPNTDEYLLLSFENWSIPAIGRYEEDDEGGAFYIGDDSTCSSFGLFVNAWMPLPEPYKPEQKEIPTKHYEERFNRVM